MKTSHSVFLVFLASAILLTSCASSTLIQSNVTGATVYIDNQKKGTTPYSYSDTKIVGSMTNITLKKEGFQDLNVVLTRNERADVGAIIGGIFVFFPFLWTMQYDPVHNYEMSPMQVKETEKEITSNGTDELMKLQSLLDQNALTKDECTALKVKILNNEYDYKSNITSQIFKLKGLLDRNLLTADEFKSQKNILIYGKVIK